MHRSTLDNEMKRNYQAIIDDLKADHLLINKQVHGADVVDADSINDFSQELEADAAVTSKKNIALSVQTADCVPVLLFDSEKNIIGAAHCGWRSARANILANVVSLMQQKGALSISAIIGPAIHQQNYEVDQPFYDEILASEPMAADLFIGKYLFDLPGFVKLKLKQLNIHAVSNACENTYTNPDKYYSYRRDVTRGEKNIKNTLSTIMLKR